MASDTVDFKYGSETFQTSYLVFGDIKSCTRPLVILNGGPGLPHYYMLPHKNLQTSKRAVILYDQIGCGDSTRLKGKPASFITPALFVAELENLIEHLGIAANFDLLGQSWGVTLSVEYIAKNRPAGLKHLVLEDGPAAYPLWRVALAQLRAQWPQDYQDMMARHEKDGTTADNEYQNGLMQFYRKHICNLEEWDPDMMKSMQGMGEDPTVYNALLGINEFVMTGSLKEWSVVPKLGSVTCPTLVINGVDDEAQDVCVAPLFNGIKGSKWVSFGKSSHMPFWEEPDRYFKIVAEFLDDSA